MNNDKFNSLISQIKNKIEQIDILDKKFTNPKYFREQTVSKIIKIVINHKDFKSYINFNAEDLKVLKTTKGGLNYRDIAKTIIMSSK